MLWGIGFSLAVIFAFVFSNWKRSQPKPVAELKPNCLLTTHPLVFITGQRSLFYFLAYWNEIPHWLASHGYEVFHFHLPWKKQQQERILLQFLLQKSRSQGRFHLFVDQSSLSIIKSLLEKHDFDCLASVTLVGHEQDSDITLKPRLSIPIEEIQLPESSNQKKPIFWTLHQLWTTQEQSISQLGWNLTREQGYVLLDRTQFLAERDLLQGQRSPTLEA